MCGILSTPVKKPPSYGPFGIGMLLKTYCSGLYLQIECVCVCVRVHFLFYNFFVVSQIQIVG